MKNQESLCSLILKFFTEKIEKGSKGVVFGKSGHFPTFVGEVTPVSFVLYGVNLTICSHIQLDKKEFIIKVFLGSEPKRYFENGSKKKLFSEKNYRQNDPHLFKVIYHEDQWKENWMEKQFPLHNPYIKYIVKAVRRVQDLFFQAERKAKKQF
ncbi:MAG: hypothetical protein AAB681_00315 [Patescibacteria group bacterium]